MSPEATEIELEGSDKASYQVEMWKKIMDEASSTGSGMSEDERAIWNQILDNAAHSNIQLYKEPEEQLDSPASRPESWGSSLLDSPSHDSTCSRPTSWPYSSSHSHDASRSSSSASRTTSISSSVASRASSRASSSSGVYSQADTVSPTFRSSWRMSPSFDSSLQSMQKVLAAHDIDLKRLSSEAAVTGQESKFQINRTRSHIISSAGGVQATPQANPQATPHVHEFNRSNTEPMIMNGPAAATTKTNLSMSLGEISPFGEVRRSRSEATSSPTRRFGYRQRVMRRMSSVPASTECSDESSDGESGKTSGDSGTNVALLHGENSSHAEMRRRARRASAIRRKSSTTDGYLISGVGSAARSRSAIQMSTTETVYPAERRVSSESILLSQDSMQVSGFDRRSSTNSTQSTSGASPTAASDIPRLAPKPVRNVLFLSVNPEDYLDSCLTILGFLLLVVTLVGVLCMPTSSRLAAASNRSS